MLWFYLVEQKQLHKIKQWLQFFLTFFSWYRFYGYDVLVIKIPNTAKINTNLQKKNRLNIIFYLKSNQKSFFVLIIKTPLYSKFRIKINWCITITGFN